jgi:hypothetical protein
MGKKCVIEKNAANPVDIPLDEYLAKHPGMMTPDASIKKDKNPLSEPEQLSISPSPGLNMPPWPS